MHEVMNEQSEWRVASSGRNEEEFKRTGQRLAGDLTGESLLEEKHKWEKIQLEGPSGSNTRF
jgi:hypothetical protein